MPANFDWQTEEDDRRSQSGWDESPQTDRPGPPRRRPPWRLIAVIAVLATAIGGVIWWRIDQQIDATLQAFRTDVVASHNLAQRAAADDDEEIFRSVLSGRVPAWTAAELELFREELFVDRSPLGLVPTEGSLPAILPSGDEEAAVDERIAAIEFSADLNEAVVTIDQPYLLDGTTETVVLQQTTVFRRGDSRWLLAPPIDEFWGDWVTSEGDYLNLIYPARDEAVAARLAADLDDEIGRMCATLADINCSADLHLTVRLDTDPATLASLSRPLGALRRAREREDILELPTPTLVGLPVEDDEAQQEAGYEALRDGYARHLLSAVIAQVVGWRCCDEQMLFEILLEYQLGELGILAWPVGEADYRRVLDSQLRLSDVVARLRGRGLADMSEEQLWETRTAVDFFANGLPGVSAAEMQRILDRARGIDPFLNGLLAAGEPGDDESLPGNLDLAWWLYAFGGTLTPSEPPIPAADEELYLACQAVDGNQSSDVSRLLRYLPDESRWDEIYNRQGFIWMSALPDPGMVLMQEFDLLTESWQTNIWRDGGISPAYIAEGANYSLAFGETDPAGQQLVTYAFEPDEGFVRAFKVDLADCDEDCATSDLPGLPTWSPDGAWAIYAGDNSGSFPETSVVAANQRYVFLDTSQEFNDLPLALGPGEAGAGSANLISLDTGRSPFWIDDRTYGFIFRTISGEPASQGYNDLIVTATLDNPIPHVVLSAADLAQFLPDKSRASNLTIGYVATHPELPQLLVITLLDEIEQRAFVFTYDLDARVPQLRMDLLYNISHSLGFSPDGRYLVLTGQDSAAVTPDRSDAVLLLHDIAQNRTIPLLTRLPFFLPSVVYDWTEDGRWLAVALDDNLVGLVAPDEGYFHLLSHGYGACTSVAWLQP